MATVPQTQGEGNTYSSLVTTGGIPERFLKRGIDNLGKMAFTTRGMNKFLFALTTRFGKGKSVKTREHKVYELKELDRTFTVMENSSDSPNSSGKENRFPLTNDQAAQVTTNDMFYNTKLFAYIQGAPAYATQGNASNNTIVGPALGWSTGYVPTGVTFSRIFGSDVNDNWFKDYEPMKIIFIDAPNSAGTGLTYLTVERVYCGPNAYDMGGSQLPLSLVNDGVQNNNGKILLGDTLLRGLPVFKEGTGAPNGFYKNPIVDNNFTQEFKYALEKTKESDIEATWLDKDPFEINKFLTTKRANMDLERTYLFGKKGKRMDGQGKVEYTMGGVVEAIKNDKEHIITYKQPTLTYQGLLDITNEVFLLGGSETRDLFVGYTLYTELKKAFYSSGYLRYDEAASAEFDIPVESIMGAGGKLNIIPLYTLEEAGYSKRGICLDMSVPSFVPVTHDGWDMRVERDIQDIGTQMYKEQLIGIKGLERRYMDYQTILDFPI